MEDKKENIYKENNLLLVSVKEKSLAKKVTDRVPTTLDTLKHYAKLSGHAALATAGLFGIVGATAVPTTAITSAVMAVTSIGIGTYGLVKTAGESVIRGEPGIAFGYKRNKRTGEIMLFQDPTQFPSYLKGLNPIQKSSVMSLQSLVGFERYKINFERTKPLMQDNDGTKVYDQKISTVTHSNNLTMLQALEDLGYLKICSRESMIYRNEIYEKIGPAVQKIVGTAEKSLERMGKSPDALHRGRLGNVISRFYPNEQRTNLLYEKIGFRNFTDLKKMAKASIEARKNAIISYKKDSGRYTNAGKNKLSDILALYRVQREAAKEEIKTFSKPIEKITFRLTDKHFNFEELYDKANGYADMENLSAKEQRAWRKLKLIFLGEKSCHTGVLALPDSQNADKVIENGKKEVKLKKIDITYDAFKRPVLKYGVKKSFGERREEFQQAIQQKQQKIMPKESDFDKRIKVKIEPQIAQTVDERKDTVDKTRNVESDREI